jgi:HK97 family phage prohead protease
MADESWEREGDYWILRFRGGLEYRLDASVFSPGRESRSSNRSYEIYGLPARATSIGPPAWHLPSDDSRAAVLGERVSPWCHRSSDDASGEFKIRSNRATGARLLAGRLASFNRWAEIQSAREGHFMERIAPEAFDKTIQKRGDRLQVLFDHGSDPAIGRKPLGRVRSFQNDGRSLDFEVELLDADYVRGLLPGLEAGLYGMSFNFRAVRVREEHWPKRSTHNPTGLPEKTLLEIDVPEFGPTPFPVYEGTSAELRSPSAA